METLVEVRDNEVFTNTKVLAEKLSKRKEQHRNVIRTLERLIRKGTISSMEAVLSSYTTSQNNIYPMYELTESGYKKLMVVIKDTFNKNKPSSIYVMSDGEFIKIGVTSNMKSRLVRIQSGNPRKVKVIYSSQVKNAQKIEHKTHKHFHEKRLMGEWFDLAPMVAVDFIEKLVKGEM